jgi:mono/diheme cytochrome c family protein
MKANQRTFLPLIVLVLAGCVTADEKSTITEIEALGGRVLYIAKDAKEYNVTITKDMFSKEKGFTAEDAKLLGALANAVEISLQHPDADDAWVKPMKGLKGLKKLHLEKTKITDAALDTIGRLSGLEYLNLYSTGVTDGGLDKLKNLKNLKSLYLWQTKVTEAKAKAFQAAMAKAGNKDLAINLGVDKDLRSVNTIARLKAQRTKSEKSAQEATAKAAKAEAERYAAIKTPTFDKDILPVIKQRCVECHGAKKQKAKLRLDSFAELMKGADGEKIFVASEPGESEIIKRINLPDSDDDKMPPKGDRLSKPIKDLIQRWIEQGGKQK